MEVCWTIWDIVFTSCCDLSAIKLVQYEGRDGIGMRIGDTVSLSSCVLCV